MNSETADLPDAAQDRLLNAMSDLLTAGRALKASQAEWEKRSGEVERLMVELGLASPRSKVYVRNRSKGEGGSAARGWPVDGPRAGAGAGSVSGD